MPNSSRSSATRLLKTKRKGPGCHRDTPERKDTMMIPAFCAGCRREIAPAELPAAAVVHPSPRVWSLIHTVHPRSGCIRRYVLNHPVHFPVPSLSGPTVAELEEDAGVRVVGMNDDRGFARLVEREEVA